MDEIDDELERMGCRAVVRTGEGQVAITAAADVEYQDVEQKKVDRLTRIMELWCDGRALTQEMFNTNEGRAPVSNILLQAFKAFKIRLYGFVRQVAGMKTFVIVDIDPAKKQNKADKGILKRAKDRVNEIGKGK